MKKSEKILKRMGFDSIESLLNIVKKEIDEEEKQLRNQDNDIYLSEESSPFFEDLENLLDFDFSFLDERR